MITGYSNKDQHIGQFGERDCFRVDLSGWDRSHPHTVTFSVPHEWYVEENESDVLTIYQNALMDGVIEYEDMN